MSLHFSIRAEIHEIFWVLFLFDPGENLEKGENEVVWSHSALTRAENLGLDEFQCGARGKFASSSWKFVFFRLKTPWTKISPFMKTGWKNFHLLMDEILSQY